VIVWGIVTFVCGILAMILPLTFSFGIALITITGTIDSLFKFRSSILIESRAWKKMAIVTRAKITGKIARQ